jgi:hypothetical protein
MSEELIFLNSRTWFPTVYYVGAFRTKFFEELRDNKIILGVKCHECNYVYIPPRSTCPRCFNRLSEWLPVSHQGIVVTYTTVYYDIRIPAIQPKKPPFTFGVIKLDGADTGLVHFIDQYHEQDLKVGMRVEAVFKDQRTGSILDIEHFRPI